LKWEKVDRGEVLQNIERKLQGERTARRENCKERGLQGESSARTENCKERELQGQRTARRQNR
jgi:hypothetical protein